MPRKWDDFPNRNATWIAPFAHGTERGGLEMNDLGAGGRKPHFLRCYRQPTTQSHWSCWLSDRILLFFLSQIFFCCFHPYTAGGSPFSHKHMMSLGGAFSKILFSAWEICGSWNQFDFRMPYVVFFQVGLKPPDLSQSKWPRCFQGCQVCLRNLDFLGRGFCEHLGMIKSTKWAPTSYIYL